MRSGKCPKCESDEVYLLQSSWTIKNHITISWKNEALLDFYICDECGYTENYISKRYNTNISEELPRVADIKRKNDELRARENKPKDDDYYFEE
jgi:C4-type Zn-finger protein